MMKKEKGWRIMPVELHSDSTGWCRETVKFEIIRKKRRKLTKLYFILKICSTRVEISLGITF
jgi:hypothetical protein